MTERDRLMEEAGRMEPDRELLHPAEWQRRYAEAIEQTARQREPRHPEGVRAHRLLSVVDEVNYDSHAPYPMVFHPDTWQALHDAFPDTYRDPVEAEVEAALARRWADQARAAIGPPQRAVTRAEWALL